MNKTQYARRLDEMGRLVIPAKLRAELRLEAKADYDFYIHETEEGERFLCIKCPAAPELTAAEAIELARKMGYNIL